MTTEHVTVVMSDNGVWLFDDPYAAAVRAAIESGDNARTETVAFGDKVPGLKHRVSIEDINDAITGLDEAMSAVARAGQLADEAYDEVRQAMENIVSVRDGAL